MQLDSKTRAMFEGLRTELGAIRTLAPKDDYNRGFNAGLEEAMRFTASYAHGRGLFQPQDELNKLHDDMERQRCKSCDMGGGQHFQECPKANQ